MSNYFLNRSGDYLHRENSQASFAMSSVIFILFMKVGLKSPTCTAVTKKYSIDSKFTEWVK